MRVLTVSRIWSPFLRDAKFIPSFNGNVNSLFPHHFFVHFDSKARTFLVFSQQLSNFAPSTIFHFYFICGFEQHRVYDFSEKKKKRNKIE